MMMMRSVFSLLVLLLSGHVVLGNKYDHDTGSNCKEKAEKEYCTKDPHTYFECPITCAEYKKPQHETWGAHEAKESPFYNYAFKDINGKTIRFDNYDGEIVIVALIPMYPGLAQFHYELLNHVLDVYKYVVDVIVLPMEGQDGIMIEPKAGSRVKILEGVADGSHRLPVYLTRLIQEGKFDPTVLNSFIISPSADHITMHIQPDMRTYRKFIDHNLKEMEE
eukprot:CAMPEP_0119014296 /NCGR_PEP_ID=MMETSP1176-20130426/9475_1 /TAXON_ID=265551 /ORGANISM="Synedropsis recta cf, Strain CCMP1620" /LENGTH=220 /DNA_ID=CAMNT_0006967451 /DNA_START=71 /DNA_END=730 /DNA_ORIENTATION=+